MNPSAPWTARYQEGVPYEIALPNESLVGLLENAVKQAKNNAALDFFGETITYAKFGELVNRAAEGLRRIGVKPGERVAIVLPNCPQHIIAFYAVLRVGAVVVEHNPLYTARELRHMFEDHAARVAICWDSAVEKLRSQPLDIELEHIISVNITKAMPLSKRLALKIPLPKLRALRKKLTTKVKGTTPWEKLVAAPQINPAFPKPKVNDLAVIQYTSGTTATPKGAMLTHLNLYANARQSFTWLHTIQLRKEVFYGVLPLFHAFGMTLVSTLGVLSQARLVLFPNFDVGMTLDAMKRIPATVFGAVPPIFHAVAAGAKAKNISLRSCRLCICGAMNLSEETMELWNSQTGTYLIEGYGMTEASPVVYGNPVGDNRKAGTVGLPFPSTYGKVVDPDDATIEIPCGKGLRGELLVKGPQIFQGYWNNPEETERTLLSGGWMRTGDIVEVDEFGYTTVVDRVKELIITGGFNVSPTEVEAVFRAHPDIADVAVVGLPLPLGGEKVAAAVVLREGSKFDEAELNTYARERLTAYKVPRTITPVAELPKSMLGKVLRKEVREALMS